MAWDMTEIIKQNDYSGTTTWNKQGITGKGVVVWNCESDNTSHGYCTTQRILHASPNATVMTVSYSLMGDHNKLDYHYVDYEGRRYDIEEFIKEFKVKIITKSVAGGTATNTAQSRYWNELKEKYNLIFFNAAGNEGTDGCTGAIPPDVAIYVGACTLTNGKPKRCYYSSVGKELDFMAFTELVGGTSCASPYLAGMTALLCERYPNITQDEVVEYFKMHTIDMEEEGRDDYSGYGLAVMGGVNEMVIKVPIGSNTINVDGREVKIDQPAVIDKTTNRTLVPLRAICEIMGANVEWDKETRTAIITRD